MEYNIEEDRVQEERRGILSKLKVPKVNVARIGRPGFVLPSFFPDIRASYSNEADEPGKKTFVIFFIKNKHRGVSSENVKRFVAQSILLLRKQRSFTFIFRIQLHN